MAKPLTPKPKTKAIGGIAVAESDVLISIKTIAAQAGFPA
jgi:hypothetical protein